jgi:hypothetical protein
MSTAKFNQWLNSDGTENYKCRAWVNFNGTSTVAIRASGNVSSITDNGTGDYTVNFTTAMPDANYTYSVNNPPNYGAAYGGTTQINSASGSTEVAPTTTAFRFWTPQGNGVAFDAKYVNVSVFR